MKSRKPLLGKLVFLCLFAPLLFFVFPAASAYTLTPVESGTIRYKSDGEYSVVKRELFVGEYSTPEPVSMTEWDRAYLKFNVCSIQNRNPEINLLVEFRETVSHSGEPEGAIILEQVDDFKDLDESDWNITSYGVISDDFNRDMANNMVRVDIAPKVREILNENKCGLYLRLRSSVENDNEADGRYYYKTINVAYDEVRPGRKALLEKRRKESQQEESTTTIVEQTQNPVEETTSTIAEEKETPAVNPPATVPATTAPTSTVKPTTVTPTTSIPAAVVKKNPPQVIGKVIEPQSGRSRDYASIALIILGLMVAASATNIIANRIAKKQ